jgi:predicted flap endonuclease-1-like 5' DNA nuclease
MELVMNMDLIREYWWLMPIALGIAILAFVLVRPRQRVRLSDSAPLRPHMAAPPHREGRGLAGEAAAATIDVAGELIDAPARRNPGGASGPADDLVQLKGVGPKLADTLRALGFNRFEQIAGLSPTELERLDDQLGAFRGRLARDRIVEQAQFLARGDTDGFEQRFGKL